MLQLEMILISQHERKKGSDFTFGAAHLPFEASLELIKKEGLSSRKPCGKSVFRQLKSSVTS